MKKPFALFFSVVLCSAMFMQAQQKWTYADCVDYARTHNISLLKLRLNEESSAYSLDEAKGQWQPTLDFATSHGYSNYPWSAGNKNSYNSSYGLNAGWTVWNGGQRENSIKKSQLQTEVSRLNTENLLRSLDTDILQVYFNILYAKESIQILTETEKVSLAQSERGKQLMEAGKMSKVDYMRLQSQYEQDHYSLVNAQTTLESRRMELKQILELGLDAQIETADVEWTAEQVRAQLPPIDESYKLAIATDAQIRGLEINKDMSEIDIAIARAGRSPKISLSAGVGTGYFAPGESFGTQMKRGVNESVGLTLSIPILDGKKTKNAVAIAKVNKLDAQLDIDKRLNELSQLVENWYIDVRSAQAQYKAAETALESAALTDELTNEQFRLGYVNTVELMQAHNSLTEARHSLLQAKYMAMLGQKMIEFYRTAKVVMP